MHVLGAPPAFFLSQDQTLSFVLDPRPKDGQGPKRSRSSRDRARRPTPEGRRPRDRDAAERRPTRGARPSLPPPNHDEKEQEGRGRSPVGRRSGPRPSAVTVLSAIRHRSRRQGHIWVGIEFVQEASTSRLRQPIPPAARSAPQRRADIYPWAGGHARGPLSRNCRKSCRTPREQDMRE